MNEKQPDSEFEPIAKEVKRVARLQAETRRWLERLDKEMDKLWHELGLRRTSRR